MSVPSSSKSHIFAAGRSAFLWYVSREPIGYRFRFRVTVWPWSRIVTVRAFGSGITVDTAVDV